MLRTKTGALEQARTLEAELARGRNRGPLHGIPIGFKTSIRPVLTTAASAVYADVPCGFTRAGLPIGIQIIGPRLGEMPVLALAYAYEQATEWHRREPSIARTPANHSRRRES